MHSSEQARLLGPETQYNKRQERLAILRIANATSTVSKGVDADGWPEELILRGSHDWKHVMLVSCRYCHVMLISPPDLQRLSKLAGAIFSELRLTNQLLLILLLDDASARAEDQNNVAPHGYLS